MLRESIAGDVFVPADHRYDEARRAWNLAADQRPAVVVFTQSAADVIQAVRFARSQGIRIAPQGTGHGAMPLEPLEDALLLKTSHMRRVDINAAAEIARAEAGALWQDVTVPAAEHGLASLGRQLAERGRDRLHARRRARLAGAPLRVSRQQRDRGRDRDPGRPPRARRRRTRA
jgi:hypothetical protein